MTGRPSLGRSCRHDSGIDGNKRHMDLRFSPITGIVEVMDEQHQQQRHASLGDALGRLSAARERRGPVGVLDPFEIVPAEDRLAAATPARQHPRRGLFSFSQRARDAAED
jgi:hypothetical protein